MITVTINAEGTGVIELPTGHRPIDAATVSTAQEQAVETLTSYAAETGHAVDVLAKLAGNATYIKVWPDGRIDPAGPPQKPTDTAVVASPVAPPPVVTPPVVPTPPSRTRVQPAPPVESGSFVKPTTEVPTSGVQAMVYRVTGGRINLGPGTTEQYRKDLVGRATKPITGTRNIVFMCLKGGISKTSTTIGVGLTLAEHRADHVLAIDANPDAGDLADRLLGHDQVEAVSPRTITDLVHAIGDGAIRDLTDLNRFTQTAERLHFISGEQDPAVSESLTASEYINVRDTVDRFYPLTLTDCGTGVTHPAMKGILETTQQIVIASGWAVTGAKRAERTLRWLHNAHDGAYSALARNAVVVLTETGPASKEINRDQIKATLGSLCRAVHVVPFDAAVSKGDLVRTCDLSNATRQAYLEVAATVIDGL